MQLHAWWCYLIFILAWAQRFAFSKWCMHGLSEGYALVRVGTGQIILSSKARKAVGHTSTDEANVCRRL